MNKGIKGICALILSLTIITTALTACGKKIERTDTNTGENTDNQNGVILYDENGNTSLSDGGYVDNNGSGDSGSYNNNGSGGSYNGGSSGGSYSGNTGSSGGSSSTSDNTSTEPTASVVDNSDTATTTKKSSIFDKFTTKEKTKKTTTTTTTTAKTTRTPTHIPVDAQKVLNSAPLSPMVTNDAQLDAKIDALLESLVTPNMTTYEKVMVVYDHFVQQYRYGYMPIRSTDSSYVSVYDTDVVARAKNFLTYKTGICVDFSAAFMVVTRRIGLNCYLVSGKTVDKYGNESYHGWNIIRINGVDYGFDPEADFRFSDGGETKYWVFCVNDPVKFKQSLTNTAVSSFKNFRTF